MAPEPQSTNKNVIKISGKEFTRKGVEAFVFIHLAGWEVRCAMVLVHMQIVTSGANPQLHEIFQNLPSNFSQETRYSLFRTIVRNVWKSLTAGGQPISELTICMRWTGWAMSRSQGWKPPVEYVFDSFDDNKFKIWSKDTPTAVNQTPQRDKLTLYCTLSNSLSACKQADRSCRYRRSSRNLGKHLASGERLQQRLGAAQA